MRMDINFKEILTSFNIKGDLIKIAPYGNGHINDTFCSNFSQAGKDIRYIHQRINKNVFKDPEGLMHNIAAVTKHQRKALALEGVKDISRRALTLVPTIGGEPFLIDDEGEYWRTYLFIENAQTYDIVETTTQAYNAAKGFAQFQKALREFDANKLVETIPDFHNTPKRFKTLKQAVAEDKCNRKSEVLEEIDFALSMEELCNIFEHSLINKEIVKRTTHNDTKLNNVMIDDHSDEAICVIDLDTVMPGVVHYDFGDLIRTSTSPVAEDESDTTKICMRWDMFEAIAKGYIETAGAFLNPREIELLPLGGKIATFEVGIRFLTDYLQGDVYFKTSREKHNLIRCRSQFALVKSIDASLDKMAAFIETSKK